MNLLSTADIQDWSTLKVVYLPSEATRSVISSAPPTKNTSYTVPMTPLIGSSLCKNQMIRHPLTPAVILWFCHLLSPSTALGLKFLLCCAFHTVVRCCSRRDTMIKCKWNSPPRAPKLRSDILEGLTKEIIKYTAYIQGLISLKKLLRPWYRPTHVCARKELALGIVDGSTTSISRRWTSTPSLAKMDTQKSLSTHLRTKGKGTLGRG